MSSPSSPSIIIIHIVVVITLIIVIIIVGIHLKNKDITLRLQSIVNKYETQFSQNINDVNHSNNNYDNDDDDDNTSSYGDNSNNIDNSARNEILIGPFQNYDHEQMLQVKNWLSSYITQNNDNNSKFITINSNRRIVNTLLQTINNSKLRKQIYIRTYHKTNKNIKNFGGLIKSRQILAKHLGYSSYLDKFLTNKVLNTPEKVDNFLLNLSDNSKDKTLKELMLLNQLKSMNERELIADDRCTTSSSSSNSDGLFLQAWDISYYRNKCIVLIK